MTDHDELQAPSGVVELSLNECASLLRTPAEVLLTLTPLDDDVLAALEANPDAPLLSSESVESWRELLS